MLSKPIAETILGTLSVAVMGATATIVGKALPGFGLVRVPLAAAVGMGAGLGAYIVIGLVIERPWRKCNVVSDHGEEPSVSGYRVLESLAAGIVALIVTRLLGVNNLAVNLTTAVAVAVLFALATSWLSKKYFTGSSRRTS